MNTETLSKLRFLRTLLRVSFLLLCPLLSLEAPALSRPYTVRDSIELTRFGGNGTATFSPSGRYFFFYGSRGNLETNQTESRIWLFETEKVKDFLSGTQKTAPQAKTLVLMCDSVNDSEVISDVRWFNDESIVFLARDKEFKHLYSASLEDGKTKLLSPPRQDVTNFVINKNAIVFTCQAMPDKELLYKSAGQGLPDLVDGNDHSLFGLVYPYATKAELDMSLPQNVWKVVDGIAEEVQCKGKPVSFTTGTRGLFLSPDNSMLVFIAHATNVPDSWEDYQPLRDNNPVTRFVADSKLAGKSRGAWNRPEQAFLLNLRSGTTAPLLDAPLGSTAGYDDAKVSWCPDGSKIVVSGVFFPKNFLSAISISRRRPGIVLIDFSSGNVQALSQLPQDSQDIDPLWQIRWKDTQELAIHYPRSCELYRKKDGAWELVKNVPSVSPAVDANEQATIVAGIDQGLNDPPHLKAAQKDMMQSPKVIFNPNQYLSQIDLGESTKYQWSDGSGSEWTGVLTKPPDFKAGRRYPLLLQTHGCSLHRFFSDGYFSPASPGRALAARGFLVLQVPDPDRFKGTFMEGDAARVGYVAAIGKLVDEGLVDPARVGIAGFSITGWFSLNALIRDPSVFAAASFADGSDAGLAGYFASVGLMNAERAKQYAQQFVGVEPFGEGLKQWLGVSPALNTDKIKAPVLCEFHSPLALLATWDLYAALRAQNKPVDLLYLRDASHVLYKPKEVFASQEMNADWFDFWLNKHEDPSPNKQGQYARWRQLRSSQQH